MKFIEDKVWTEILNYFYKKQYGSIKGNIKGVQFEALVAFLLKLYLINMKLNFILRRPRMMVVKIFGQLMICKSFGGRM